MQAVKRLMGVSVNKPGKENYGFLRDIYINPRTSIVEAILVEQAGLFGKKAIIPWEYVTGIGDDGIWIKPDDPPKVPSDQTWWSVASTGENAAYGRDILAKGGESLGTIGDYLIDPVTGHIIGCELSDGLLQDLIEGRKNLQGELTLAEDGNSLLFQ
jgi:uncharacterized protein YrrD